MEIDEDPMQESLNPNFARVKNDLARNRIERQHIINHPELFGGTSAEEQIHEHKVTLIACVSIPLDRTNCGGEHRPAKPRRDPILIQFALR